MHVMLMSHSTAARTACFAGRPGVLIRDAGDNATGGGPPVRAQSLSAERKSTDVALRQNLPERRARTSGATAGNETATGGPARESEMRPFFPGRVQRPFGATVRICRRFQQPFAVRMSVRRLPLTSPAPMPCPAAARADA